MNRYKLVVAYDGTDFYGWTPQPELRSVAQVMQDVFHEVFKKKISLVGASRTDAGVHALGQVARFHTDVGIEVNAMRKAWNARLPGTIVIRSLEHASDDFHPHHNIINKTYYYHFFLSRPLPFVHRYGVHCHGNFDMQHLHQVLQLFVGTHDFSSFSTGEPIGSNPICTIQSINVQRIKRFGVYQISITGNRFLRHMVRRMVGAALMSAQKKNNLSVADVQLFLDAKDSRNCLLNAPSHGLLLYKVLYK